MLLDRSVQGEESLKVFKIFKWSFELRKVTRNAALQRKGMEIPSFKLTAAGKCS
jgi:hypothetical protein